jgi:1-acyl-sn-glycerol-3-phosphate acyltransferase
VGTLRFVVRAGLILVWLAIMFGLRLLALPVMVVAPRLELRISQALFHWFSRVLWHIVGMRVTVRGTPPRAPFFMVSNHLTYLDLFVLTGTVGCVFVSRADVAGWPVVGFMARRMNTIFINRQRLRDTVRVNEEIRRAMAQGYGVHVFAESGVSQDASVRDFKPALLQPAAELGLPVYYACLHYQTPPDYPGAKDIVVWREGVSLAENMSNVLRLPYLDALVEFGENPVQAPDRKALASELCAAVRARVTPTV